MTIHHTQLAHSMKANMTPGNFHPLHDTPQGRARVESIYARLRSKLTPLTPPSEVIGAWANLRQELYVEPGLEGLTGPAATYHLIGDVPDYLLSAAELLTGRGFVSLDVSTHMAPRAAMGYLSKGMGWRYLRGVDGIADALCARRVSPAEIAKFQANRMSFAGEFVRKANAAWEVNDQGENPAAVMTVLTMFMEEMFALAGWLEVAGKGGESDALKRNLDNAMHVLRQGPTDAPVQKRKRSSKKYKAGYWN